MFHEMSLEANEKDHRHFLVEEYSITMKELTILKSASVFIFIFAAI